MIGRQVSHYRILELVSEGGMGAVYKAEDLDLHRTVAIKVVRAAGRDAERAAQLFLREARIAASIDQPNVVTVYEVLQEGDESYLVMQFLEGASLREVLRRRPPDLAEALRVACEIGAALRAAHRLGIVHRDLKPENVMVTADGTCKVLDFGVAHLADRSTLQEGGGLVGTVPYMAPEQVRGGPVDARTDVYGLGVVLFEMLTGRLPQESAAGVAQLYEILNRPAPSLLTLRPDLPADLARVVAQALEKRPADRYPGVAEMLHDLELVRARHTGPGPREGRLYARSRRWRAVVLGAAALAVVAAAGLLLRPLASRGPVAPAGPRIMVARWEDPLPDESRRWLASGVMDCLIRSLVGRGGLRVISRETVGATLAALTPAAPSPADVMRAARRVRARYLVAGSVEAAGRGVRILCDLTDVHSGELVRSWSREVPDLDADFYPAMDALAAAIAGETGVAAAPARGGIARELPESIDALHFYHMALEHEQAQELPAALDALHRAVAEDSDFTDAQLLIARLSPVAAERARALARAMASRGRAAPATRALTEAAWLEEAHRDAEAARAYAALLARDPENVQAGAALATLDLHMRRFADAAAQYAALHEVTPCDFSFYPAWSTACIEIGRRDRALALLEEWRRQFPRAAGPLRWLIGTRLAFGDHATALALCDTLDQLVPGAASTQRGFVCSELGRMHEAERLFTGLLAAPDRYGAPARGRSYLALLCLRERRFARGLELIEPARREDPGTYNDWLAGSLAAGAGELARADTCAAAIARRFTAGGEDSSTAEALGDRRFYYHLRGRIALAAGRPDEALRLFERALRASSRVDEAYFRTDYARAWLARGDPARAARELAAVLADNPRYPEALLELGRADLRLGRRAEARRALRTLRGLWRGADADFVLNQELGRLWRESAAAVPRTG